MNEYLLDKKAADIINWWKLRLDKIADEGDHVPTKREKIIKFGFLSKLAQ